MKITLEINDNTICAFFNSVVNTNTGLTMFSHQIGSNDLEDGNTINSIDQKDYIEDSMCELLSNIYDTIKHCDSICIVTEAA